jgi:GPH family glycoside/pentoside/hexuronide:cation symporter
LVLCFSVPNFSEGAKLIYAYITYSLLSLAYTIVNVPLGSLLPALTEDSVERTNLATIRIVLATIGSTIVAALTLPMVNLFGKGNDAIGFRIVAIIFAIIGVAILFFSVANTREISVATGECKVSLMKNLVGMAKCKIFWVNNIVAFFMFGGYIIGAASLTFYFIYVVQNQKLASISATLLIVVGLIGNVIPPVLIKYMSKKNGIILGNLVVILGIAIIFFGGKALAMQVIGIIIYGIGHGLRQTLIFAISPDAIDCCSRKIGSNVAGAFSAMTGFCVKVSSAIASSLVASLLAMGNYDATLEIQPQSAVNMIIIAFIFIPILC